MPRIATAQRVDRDAVVDFLCSRHRATLVTTRRDGRPQLSLVTCGIDGAGRVVVSTYPQRAKVHNVRANPAVSLCIQSDDWNDEYLQVDGRGEIVEGEDGVEALVDYFRGISGEHPDWEEYRQAMRTQGKVLLRITIERWGPIAAGGFPPEVAARM